MFADELRRAVETAPRITLPSITALLWRAFGAGQVSEDEAAEIEALIEARTVLRSPNPATSSGTPADRPGSPRKAVGSRPRTDASLERRRRWAASGRLPPALAARFTLAEQAVLALVAVETVKRGDCRLPIRHIAAVTGVSETTVRRALRQAKALGLATIEERRQSRFRSETNIVRIASPEWQAWLRLTRKGRVLDTHPLPTKGGGCQSRKGTTTGSRKQALSGSSAGSKGLSASRDRPNRGGEPAGRAGGIGQRATR